MFKVFVKKHPKNFRETLVLNQEWRVGVDEECVAEINLLREALELHAGVPQRWKVKNAKAMTGNS